MNLCHALTAAILAFAANTARADLPTAAEWLGTTEAFANACAQFNPAHAAEYKNHVQSLLVPGTTEAQLAEIRKTSQYKQSYEALLAELNEAPKEQAAKEGCLAFLETHN